MTLETWIAAGAIIITLVICGGTMGVMAFALFLHYRSGEERQRALAEQAEAHRMEMREMADYNARLERRVTELEAQITLMVEVLNKRGISMPKTGPLNVTAGGDITIGGDVAGRDKRP